MVWERVGNGGPHQAAISSPVDGGDSTPESVMRGPQRGSAGAGRNAAAMRPHGGVSERSTEGSGRRGGATTLTPRPIVRIVVCHHIVQAAPYGGTVAWWQLR